ncbi:FadR/GntR family transcriptional regulator [Aneurinibacillus sp. Ricciae_BoGa-3]|uniref:FadR/GntR family transcriptional regulator n=1 Tax=Aneurinibacillus sp. Ricciae_BoGa-3 TaxID=3022697 RepID=UPI0023411E9E|nr:FadR/GntR family transcriptional regulator [Aneurinibacillus sp. Ricciae_BoGa-3]WCK55188.1 FadR/GntR family transcriptional regulator [Aneurinibacillus sp. Ricciae_BoGa-3]
MYLNKTNRLSLVEQVASQIESLIETGQWPVGMRIPAEPELVASLGVSRNTLREAIRALAHAGLLTAKQGDGTYVCSASPLGAALKRRIKQSNILETLDVRHALEREAAYLAAIRRTSEDIKRIRSHLSACDEALEANDKRAYMEYDIKLHQSIIEATHNSVLMDLYEHMTDALTLSVHGLIEIISDFHLHQRIHQNLVEAIIESDPNEAAVAVYQYIEKFREELQLNMEEKE